MGKINSSSHLYCLRSIGVAALLAVSLLTSPLPFNAGGVVGDMEVKLQKYGTDVYKIKLQDKSGQILTGYDYTLDVPFERMSSDTFKINKPAELTVILEGHKQTVRVSPNNAVLLNLPSGLTPMYTGDSNVLQPITTNVVYPDIHGDIYVSLNNKVAKILVVENGKYKPLHGIIIDDAGKVSIEERS